VLTGVVFIRLYLGNWDNLEFIGNLHLIPPKTKMTPVGVDG